LFANPERECQCEELKVMKAYLVDLILEFLDRVVYMCRLAFKEEIMADGPAADGARGGVCRHSEVSELLEGSSNGFQVALCIFALGLLATLDRQAIDVFHDEVSTPPAQEEKVNLGDAHNALRVDVHDLGYLVLCAGLP
jgi:hypothetical protein